MPSDQPKTTELQAQEIIQEVDRFRQRLWPRWRKERLLTSFYNAEKTYVDYGDQEADDQNIPDSFGVGNRFIRKPFDQLCDSILDEPGFIKSELLYPLAPQRKSLVESAFDLEVNGVVHKRLQNLIKSMVGRALITGKSFSYRLSRWDWLWKSGRLLHDISAPNDIWDDNFREWGFTGIMSLRQIDEYIESTRNYDGKGWSKQGLENLKKWILQSTAYERDLPTSGNTVPIQQIMEPFDIQFARQNLDVYWYFRKNGRRNPQGHERIDLYCVSRWMNGSQIDVRDRGDRVVKSLSINYGKDEKGDGLNNQQIIYFLPDAFEDVSECLVGCMLDDRIDGEQTMVAMEGLGRLMVNRIIPMEHLMGSMISGLAWAAQPNFQATSGADMEELRKMAQEGGVGPWDGIPTGMTMVQKNNSLTGLSSALQVIQMLGMSADQDAATGEISSYSNQQIELKDLANRWIQQTDVAVGRRKGRFFQAMDAIAAQITELFGRTFTEWKKGDPGYYEVLSVQQALILKHGLSPVEFSSERLTGKSRRLSGNADRSQVVQRNAQFGQMYGGQMAPEGVRFLAKDSARAVFGDAQADMMFPEQPEVPVDQQVMATAQESMCLVSLQLPQRNPQDNPIVHSLHHMQAISGHLQVAQQAGSWTPERRMGVQLLFQHMAMDMPGMPVEQQRQMAQAVDQMARVAASVQVSGQMTAQQLKEMDAQRKTQELQLKIEHENNLKQDRAAKLDMKQQDFFLKAENASQMAKSAGVDRAKKLQEMAEPPEPAATSA